MRRVQLVVLAWTVMAGVIAGSPETSPALGPKRCEAILHVGDSLTLTMVPELLATYRSQGFQRVQWSAARGRSMHAPGRAPDKTSGLEAARKARSWSKARGLQPCWVIALGTNDAAGGSSRQLTRGIRKMLEIIDGDPAVWVNVWMFDTAPDTKFTAANSLRFNRLLASEAAKVDNLTVLDWAGFAQPFQRRWYRPDHLHLNKLGLLNRARFVGIRATALLRRAAQEVARPAAVAAGTSMSRPLRTS